MNLILNTHPSLEDDDQHWEDMLLELVYEADEMPTPDPIHFSKETVATPTKFSFSELDFLSCVAQDEDAFDLNCGLDHLDHENQQNSVSKPVVIPSQRLNLVKKNPAKKKRRICRIDGCDRLDRGLGMCGTHGGGRRCRVPNCSKASRKKGLCCGHYRDTFEKIIDTSSRK